MKELEPAEKEVKARRAELVKKLIFFVGLRTTRYIHLRAIANNLRSKMLLCVRSREAIPGLAIVQLDVRWFGWTDCRYLHTDG